MSLSRDEVVSLYVFKRDCTAFVVAGTVSDGVDTVVTEVLLVGFDGAIAAGVGGGSGRRGSRRFEMGTARAARPRFFEAPEI